MKKPGVISVIVSLMVLMIVLAFNLFELSSITISTQTINEKISEKLPISKKYPLYTLNINNVAVNTLDGMLVVDVISNIQRSGECIKIKPSDNGMGVWNKVKNIGAELSKECQELSNKPNEIVAHTEGTIHLLDTNFYYKPSLVVLTSQFDDDFLNNNQHLIDPALSKIVKTYLAKMPVYSLDKHKILSMAIKSIDVLDDKIVVNISLLKLTKSLLFYVFMFIAAFGMFVILLTNPSCFRTLTFGAFSLWD